MSTALEGQVVAVIGGTGALGSGLAKRLAAAGVNVIIGSRTAEKAQESAMIAKQPYHVWYPLLLGGGIGTIVLGSLIPVVRMRYKQAERRKLDAEGIRNS